MPPKTEGLDQPPQYRMECLVHAAVVRAVVGAQHAALFLDRKRILGDVVELQIARGRGIGQQRIDFDIPSGRLFEGRRERLLIELAQRGVHFGLDRYTFELAVRVDELRATHRSPRSLAAITTVSWRSRSNICSI